MVVVESRLQDPALQPRPASQVLSVGGVGGGGGQDDAPSLDSRAPSLYSVGNDTRPLIGGDGSGARQARDGRGPASPTSPRLFRKFQSWRATRKSGDLSSPSSRATLAPVGESPDVPLLPAQAYGRMKTLDGGEEELGQVAALSPDGLFAASLVLERTVRVWSLAHAVEVRQIEHIRNLKSVAFSPDGRLAATFSDTCHVRVFDAHSWEEMQRDDASLIEGGRATQLIFSPDSRFLVAGGRMFDTDDWAQVEGVTDEDDLDGWTTATFAEDEPLVALHSPGLTPSLKFWDMSAGAMSPVTVECRDPVYFVACSPDGRTLATSTFKEVQLWDMSSAWNRSSAGTALVKEVVALPNHNTPMAFSPDGGSLALRRHSELLLCNSANLAVESRFAFSRRPTAYVNGLGFASDGRALVVTFYEPLLGLKAWEMFHERLPLPAGASRRTSQRSGTSSASASASASAAA